jgi:tetratricopeptide (TPR) repeat protein
MTFKYFILTSTVLLLLLPSCGGPKALYKKGAKYEETNNFEEAAQYYYLALSKKSEFPEARQGLNRTGKKVMSQKMSAFFESSQKGNKQEAIYVFQEAKAYQEKLRPLGIELHIPSQYRADFEILKNDFLIEQYEVGLSLMDEKQFEAAEEVFREIERIQPDYKDSKKLREISYMEPYYIKGLSALDDEAFRTAYYAFDEVCMIDPSYKNAHELKDEALENGMITLGLIPFENGTSKPQLETKATAITLNALSRIEDPFCKVLDRTNIEEILAAHELNLSGIVNESTAAEAGELLGVKYLIGGTVLEASTEKGEIKRLKKWGHEQLKKEVVNPESGEKEIETSYKKVAYYTHEQRNRAYASIQVKILSLATGEVLFSKLFSTERADEVFYATYSGDYNSLFPDKEGNPDTSRSMKKKLNEMFKAKREIRSVESLSDEAFKALALEVEKATEQFTYSHVR